MTGHRRVLAAVRWEDIQEIHEEWKEHENRPWEYQWWVITTDKKRVTLSSIGYIRVREMEQLGKQIREAFWRLHPPTFTALVETIPAVFRLTNRRTYTRGEAFSDKKL